MDFQLFLTSFISLFVVVDPFGTAAVFSVLTGKFDRPLQRRIALKAVLIAASLLIGFSLVGNALLSYLHISLSAFRISGGILLFVFGFRMVLGFHDPDHLDSERSVYRDRTDIAVFPLAIPLLTGPGAISAALMFATSAKSMADHAQVWLAILLVEGIAAAALIAAPTLTRVLGHTGNGIIARIMGILLAAMAIQFISDGLGQLWTPEQHYNVGLG